MIRDLKKADIVQLMNIQCSFPFPDLSRSISSEVIERDGNLIAMGTLVKSVEAVMILDLSQPKMVRARAISQLLGNAIYTCQKLGYEQVHAFLASDANFTNLLKNKFGFVDIKGVPLVLNL